ncbi:hypothetical protein AMTRI_Chr02g222770 [Amborella trichopoda]|uniref:UspA domain-containing protein n=1 Tax=Amborella trichopoda TaxID=13333 RepID=W1P3N1_AMBTC|nr:universal stress protein PHOS34 [Amborella trichopoda]ERN02239.1 hypothetical protein AMTR_s00045p00225160 [Amborella trichopoda]|eukprot:XP_006840564.1 universal stress protein PHOS34 [Amborella trichopoda]
MESEACAKSVLVVGLDESPESFHALEWTLDHIMCPLAGNSPFKLVIVHAKPPVTSYLAMPGPGAIEVLPLVEAGLKKSAERIVQRASDICKAKSVNDFTTEVVEGDARNVLCEAVEKHQATMLAVGSHGYGAIKRAVLGSVSDYCSHHAHCTVMIVKKPKHKH